MNNINFTQYKTCVEELLNCSNIEKTQKIFLIDADGKRIGPYIKKTITKSENFGTIYKDLAGQSNIINNCNQLPCIFDFYEDETNIVVFQEYFNGLTLDKYMTKHNYSQEKVDDIFLQLCSALEVLHTKFSKPIIHRDIKPQNILINKEGKLKLIDFGIARKFSNKNITDTKHFGTVGYASPEQFGYKQTDVKSDIFSAGKVLEYMLNQNNWKSKTKTHNLGLYTQFLQTATAFDPSLRYKNVQEMKSAYIKVTRGGSLAQRLANNRAVIILGHIWNLLLASIVTFLLVLSFYVVVLDSSSSLYSMSVNEKIIFLIMINVFIFFGAFAIFSYKPSIRKIFKQLPYFKFAHYVIFILFCTTMVMICAIFATFIKS